MNCIWILLLLFCGGNNCGYGSNWSSCGNNCSRANRCGCNSNWSCGSGCESNCNTCSREATCETVCESVCEAARDRAQERAAEADCGCRRPFPYTSYPVLDHCD